MGFFELRIYTTKPGKRDALAARFGDYTTKIYSRHGIANVGYWFAASHDLSTGVPWVFQLPDRSAATAASR